ncbi:Bifunctional epoxide hydrolase 2 [Merluccius polli]|uniref:Bifunctional epoxide hydrolase 2 n=1 Tax=Merluccius polli TaxID=89951 RepID=A0AA47MIT7_MERPO|nr:Bifunctional epoxide hydrolase 2 [Merluccius polli]
MESAVFILHRRRARVFYDLLGRVAEEHVTLCFDMMQNMVLPKTPIGQAYYSRQLFLYLFGVVVHHGENSHQTKDDVHLYVWQENEGRKDSNVIASALSDCLKVQLHQKVGRSRGLRLFSDSCYGQNKNMNMVSMLMELWNSFPNLKIEHTFPVRGHSFLPADRVFGRIEQKIKKEETILLPEAYYAILKQFGHVHVYGTDWKGLDFKSATKACVKSQKSFKISEARMLDLSTNKVGVKTCYNGEYSFYSVLKRGKCWANLKPEVLYLAEDEEGVQAAEAEGMKAILVEDLTDALNKLTHFTELPVASVKDTPLSCNPDDMLHGYVSIKPGVKTHYIQMGCGPPVLLCHGFPESWYSWRYQIPALAAAGFSVFALDMKGYGESTAPADIEEYSLEQLCKDLITFMDKLAIPQVTLVGHDWGGALVWSMAQYYPERVRAVASLNTPLFPVDPTVDPMQKLKAFPIFDYQIYFQEPGVAEAELEEDLKRTFKIFFVDSNHKDMPKISTAGVCARGGLFVGLPEDIAMSNMLSESDLQYYINQYKDSGFKRPLNWYRNVERNWKWMCSRPRGKLMMPALMLTAGKDIVLLPVLSKGMEEKIPNLTRGHIEECGHWTQMEKPAEVNRILISWLQETHRKLAVTMAPKL